MRPFGMHFRRIMAALLLMGIGVLPASGQTLTVFAAASLTDAIDALTKDFESRTGFEVTVVTAASSTLARQMEKGAPADIFISASKEWADYLATADGYAPPRALFGNRLVLVSRQLFDVPPELVQLPELLVDGRLAVGDPAHVPAGQYAQQALEAAGIWGRVKDRLAPASDVRGALSFVAQGAAPYGIVYATDAGDDVPIVLQIDAALHAPIIYYAVTKQAASEAVGTLLDYLLGPDAGAILSGMGFVPAKE